MSPNSMIRDFDAFLRRVWHDPVWSKVIAALIVALLIGSAAFVASYVFRELRAPWVIGSAVVSVAMWIVAFFILFRPASRIITPQEVGRRPYYRRSIRCCALCGAIVASALPLAPWAVSAFYQLLAPDAILILIADFETRPTDASYRVTRTIAEQLKQVTSPYKELTVQRLRKPIPWQDGTQTALRLGAERQAAVVIWGDFDTTSDSVIVSTNIEIVPRPGLGHRRGWNTSTEKLSELNHFTLQQRLSHEVSFMTLFIFGVIRYGTGDAEGSIGPLTDALQRSVENYNPKDILFTRARAFFELERYEDALADLDRVIAIEPTYDHAFTNRGTTYLALREYDKAVADLTEAIALKPCDALAYRNRSSAYYDLRKLDLAIADATAAVACDSRDPLAYIVRGNARDRKGDLDGALADYGTALKLSPKNVWAYFNRGVAYRRHGDYVNAVADFDRAIRVDSTFVHAYRARAITYWQNMGRIREAAEDFRAILKLRSSNDMKDEARSALEKLGQTNAQ